MSNLIVTIISIALTAIAAVMGIFYGGTAFENAQINATASTIVSEAQQILTAERMWAVNNGQPDISGMARLTYPGMAALVASKELAEWPSAGGYMISLTYPTSAANPGPQPWIAGAGAATIATGIFDDGCYSINGNYGWFTRYLFSYNNGNYVGYIFTVNIPYTTPCGTQTGTFASSSADTSKINQPVVQIASAINKATGQVPANATMWAVGLPYAPSYATQLSGSYYPGSWAPILPYQSNNTVQSNYCYLYSTVTITCVFGPS